MTPQLLAMRFPPFPCDGNVTSCCPEEVGGLFKPERLTQYTQTAGWPCAVQQGRCVLAASRGQQRRKGVSFLWGAGIRAGKATVATWRVGLAHGRSCLLPWHCLFCVHSLLWGLGEGTEAAENICGVQGHWYPAFVVLLCDESFSVLPTSGQICQKSFCLCSYREKPWKIYLGNVTHSLNYTL